jgi:small subunit ribosomal protein S10e
MIIPTPLRKKILAALFQEGTMVAKKDLSMRIHPIGAPNLYVVNLMKSMDSRGFLKTQYSWNYYYYTLTDAGTVYLRQYLSLPEEVVPNAQKKAAVTRSTFSRPEGRDGDHPGGRGRGGMSGGRGGYRRAEGESRGFGGGRGGAPARS